MARLAIGKEFLAEYAKLDRDTRSAVDTGIAEFARQTHAGPFLETPRDSRDSRIRTIGIDGVWRGVVLAPDSGDTYCLLTVLPHEKVNNFRRQPPVRRRTGVPGARGPGRGGAAPDPGPPVRRVARVLAPESARDRLPRELLRVGPGHRWPRHRQDGDRAAPRGHPGRARRTAQAPAPRPADHVQRQPGRITPRPTRTS